MTAHTQQTTAPAHSINPRWPVWSLIKMKFILRERVRSVDELFSLITSSIVVRLAVHNLNDNIVFYFTSFFCCCCCHIFFCRKKLFIIITGINYKHTVVVWLGYTIVHQTKGQRERKQKKKNTRTNTSGSRIEVHLIQWTMWILAYARRPDKIICEWNICVSCMMLIMIELTCCRHCCRCCCC